MSDFSYIDYDLKPQPRERSCTWPMKRPAICSKEKSNDSYSSNTLQPALEEPSVIDELMTEGVSLLSNFLDVQDGLESPDELSYPSFLSFPDVDNNATSETAIKDQVAEFAGDSSQILTPEEKIAMASDTLNNNFIKLETIPQERLLTTSFGFGNTSSKSTQSNAESNLKFINNLSTSPDKQTKILASASGSTTAKANTSSTVTASKPKSSSRKNAWGNLSYADLITQAIESSLEKRLTLAQIYDWMVKNIEYFKDKGDSNSSAGWKNSIRHNLSLHNKFKRMQNEGTGKSSWWVINYDAKPHKPNRRRAVSLETNNSKMKSDRAKALTRKSELLKKKGLKRNSNEGGLGDGDQQRNSSFFSDFRHRNHSDASSIGERISPHKPHLVSDLEPEGPHPLSPTRLSSSYTAPSAFAFIGRNGDFNMTDRSDTMTNPDKLLERLESMDILPVSPPLQGQANDNASIYLNQVTSAQHQQQAKVTGNSSISANNSMTIANQANQGSAPNIRLLISKNTQPNTRFSNADLNFATGRPRSNVHINAQHQPTYEMADSNSSFKQSEEQVVQHTVLLTNGANNQSSLMTSPQAILNQFQYGQVQQPQYQQRNQQQHYQPQQVYVQQQGNGGNLCTSIQQVASNNQQSLTMLPTDQQNFSGLPTDSYDGIRSQVEMMGNLPSQQQANEANMATDSKYPSDLCNLDQSEIFNPGSVDFSEFLQDINPSDMNGMDFTSFFPQESNIELFDNSADGGRPPVAFSTSQYPPNPPCLMSGSRSSSGEQVAPQLVPLNSIESCQSQVFTVLNAPLDGTVRNNVTNVTMLLQDDGENIRGFSNHFAHSHPVKVEQLSQGVGVKYQMR